MFSAHVGVVCVDSGGSQSVLRGAVGLVCTELVVLGLERREEPVVERENEQRGRDEHDRQILVRDQPDEHASRARTPRAAA